MMLSEGIKYNLHTKSMDWIKNFTETAISYIPVAEQDYMRWQVAKKTGSYIETQQNIVINYLKNRKDYLINYRKVTVASSCPFILVFIICTKKLRVK